MKKLSDLDWSRWQAKDPATLVFVVRDGKILLINKKTGLGKGKVNGPGGKVEKGESPEDCAVRECQEELGITVSNLQYCGQHLIVTGADFFTEREYRGHHHAAGMRYRGTMQIVYFGDVGEGSH
jgi:8-oxo-dGTP pyrophosphatase MutT (NUDIX family)